MKYSEKLRDPRWQKRRLEVLERDEWMCYHCCDTKSTLHVHHRYYTDGAEPWEYPDEALLALCERCHDLESRSRPGVEKRLLQALRREFLAGDLIVLAEAFEGVMMRHEPDVMAPAIRLALTDHELVGEMLERYFEHIRKANVKLRA